MSRRAPWRLPAASSGGGVPLSARDLRQAREMRRPLIATRSFVAETPYGFARIVEGVTRIRADHRFAVEHPGSFRLGPPAPLGGVADDRAFEERSGGVASLADHRERADAGPDQHVMTGHFAVFDQWAEIRNFGEGHFMERIAHGAFRRTLAEDRQTVLLQHGRDPSLGLKPLGAVRHAAEDGVGARYAVDLFRGVPDLVIDGLRAGAYGSSFVFNVLREDLVEDPGASAHNPAGLPERVLTEVYVKEYGPVTFAAYGGATATIEGAT